MRKIKLQGVGPGPGPLGANTWGWHDSGTDPHQRSKEQEASSTSLTPGWASLVTHAKNKSLDLTQPQQSCPATMAVPSARERCRKTLSYWQITVLIAWDLYFTLLPLTLPCLLHGYFISQIHLGIIVKGSFSAHWDVPANHKNLCCNFRLIKAVNWEASDCKSYSPFLCLKSISFYDTLPKNPSKSSFSQQAAFLWLGCPPVMVCCLGAVGSDTS